MTNPYTRTVEVRFALPDAQLAPLVSAISFTDVKPAPGERYVEDVMLPSWSNLWFSDGSWQFSRIDEEYRGPAPRFCMSGPLLKSARFRSTGGRIWSIGLMPLGWATLVSAPAYKFVDAAVDAAHIPAFSKFWPLAQALAETVTGSDNELATIQQHLASLNVKAPASADKIAAINTAIVDPALGTVGELAERAQINLRTLQRLSKRTFGFSPQALIRRQRFVRSLATFVTDPSANWRAAMDGRYYDQAQFSRDFKAFMGMGPSEYAKLDKPIFTASMRARQEAAGQAMQALHKPVAGEDDG